MIFRRDRLRAKVFNSINAPARKVIELAGSKSNVEHLTYQQAYGQPFDDMARRVPCLKRVKATIGFSPVFGLEEIIRSVIADRSQVGQLAKAGGHNIRARYGERAQLRSLSVTSAGSYHRACLRNELILRETLAVVATRACLGD